MFGRTKAEDPATPVVPAGTTPSGKGRPTPTRKEAEQARRERAKMSQGKKSGIAADRDGRREQRKRIRDGMRAGDERYLLARDRGPVKRFIRDRVDSRLSAAEFVLPLLIAVMFFSYSPSLQLKALGNAIWLATLLVTLVDSTVLTLRMRKELGERFPGQTTKGWWGYMMLRALQLRFLRMPKTQRKLGDKLPQHYR